MDNPGLYTVIRLGMFVVAIGLLAVVSFAMRNRPRTNHPPTAVSGRRGPLLAVGALGGIMTVIGQWSDWPENVRLRLCMLFVSFALAIAGLLGWMLLVRARID